MKTFLLVILVILVPVVVSGQPGEALDPGHRTNGPSKEASWFKAAICNGSLPKTEWILATNNPPTAACLTGKDVTKGVLDFDANEDQSAILPYTLPPHFAGNIHLTIRWQPASTIGSVGWCVELVPSADLNREGGASITHTVRNCASEEAKKSGHDLNRELVIHLVAKVPASNNDVLHIRLTRDANSSVVLEYMPGNARVFAVGIQTHEAPR